MLIVTSIKDAHSFAHSRLNISGALLVNDDHFDSRESIEIISSFHQPAGSGVHQQTAGIDPHQQVAVAATSSPTAAAVVAHGNQLAATEAAHHPAPAPLPAAPTTTDGQHFFTLDYDDLDDSWEVHVGQLAGHHHPHVQQNATVTDIPVQHGITRFDSMEDDLIRRDGHFQQQQPTSAEWFLVPHPHEVGAWEVVVVAQDAHHPPTTDGHLNNQATTIDSGLHLWQQQQPQQHQLQHDVNGGQSWEVKDGLLFREHSSESVKDRMWDHASAEDSLEDQLRRFEAARPAWDGTPAQPFLTPLAF